jgi:hypothetical protein
MTVISVVFEWPCPKVQTERAKEAAAADTAPAAQ